MTHVDPAGAPEHLTNPEFEAPPARIWPGAPVVCGECSQAGVPVMTGDGWRLPLHALAGSPTVNCVGSLAGVNDPVPNPPSQEAVPSDYAPEVPDASRLVE